MQRVVAREPEEEEQAEDVAVLVFLVGADGVGGGGCYCRVDFEEGGDIEVLRTARVGGQDMRKRACVRGQRDCLGRAYGPGVLDWFMPGAYFCMLDDLVGRGWSWLGSAVYMSFFFRSS